MSDVNAFNLYQDLEVLLETLASDVDFENDNKLYTLGDALKYRSKYVEKVRSKHDVELIFYADFKNGTIVVDVNGKPYLQKPYKGGII